MQTLTLFYDGNCPLCLAEIHLLKSRNHQQLLAFIDVTENIDEHKHGVSCAAALQSMHGQLADGTIIQGVAVFREAYTRVGWHTMAWVLSIQSLQPLFDLAYYHFAKHRQRIATIIGKPLLWLSRKYAR